MTRRAAVVLLTVASLACSACAAPARAPAPGAHAPPAPGSADLRAARIADAVMKKLGGRKAWDQTHYVTFSAAGRRYLWDRFTADLRMERAGPRSGRPYIIVLNIKTAQGRAWREGQEVTEPSDLSPMLDAARREWDSDSYWLLMPYELRDAGVTLRSLGESPMQDGRAAELLEVTFKDDDIAHHGKYHVWVARDTGLVEQWAFYEARDSPSPAYTCPWKGWTRYGNILLCGDHGEVGGKLVQLTGIAVLDQVPATAFTSPDHIDWDTLLQNR